MCGDCPCCREHWSRCQAGYLCSHWIKRTACCSCPSQSQCYHIIAAQMWIGFVEEQPRWIVSLDQLRKNKQKCPDKTCGPKMSAGSWCWHQDCWWHHCSHRDCVNWMNHRTRCTCKKERCEICLLTLLATWLTLDYYDSCILNCGGWHYFSSVLLRRFCWFCSTLHYTGYLAGTDLLKLSQGWGLSYVKDSSGMLVGLHVCFVQNKQMSMLHHFIHLFLSFHTALTQYISCKHLIVRNSNNQHHILGLWTMELRILYEVMHKKVTQQKLRILYLQLCVCTFYGQPTAGALEPRFPDQEAKISNSLWIQNRKWHTWITHPFQNCKRFQNQLNHPEITAQTWPKVNTFTWFAADRK